MTILTESIKKILNLPFPMDEAPKKLFNTFMLVNGKVEYVNKMYPSTNKISTDEFEIKKIVVETLEVFMPEAGQYMTKDGLCVKINKVPFRQWLKSFSPLYYQQEKTYFSLSVIELAKTASGVKTQILVDLAQNIWFEGSKIGYVENEKIVCTDKRFEQELIDWNNT